MTSDARGFLSAPWRLTWPLAVFSPFTVGVPFQEDK